MSNWPTWVTHWEVAAVAELRKCRALSQATAQGAGTGDVAGGIDRREVD